MTLLTKWYSWWGNTLVHFVSPCPPTDTSTFFRNVQQMWRYGALSALQHPQFYTVGLPAMYKGMRTLFRYGPHAMGKGSLYPGGYRAYGRSRHWGRRIGRVRRRDAGVVALREVRRIRSSIEVKYYTQSITVNIATGAGLSSISMIPAPSVGDGPTSRHGDKIKWTSFAAKYVCGWGSAADARDIPMRCMIVYDRSPRGVLPAVTDILAFENITSPYKISDPATLGRFQVIHDRIYQGTDVQWTVFDKFYTGRSFKSIYGGTAGTITDCDVGAFYVIQVRHGASTGNTSIKFDIQQRYEDL